MPDILTLLSESRTNPTDRAYRLRPMNEAEAEGIMRLTFAELDRGALTPLMTESVGFQIINNRLRWAGLAPAEVTNPFVVALCVVLAQGRPGTCVLWAFAIKEIYGQTGAQVDLASFTAVERFGYGVPTEEFYHEVWLSQKGYELGLDGVDNYLDTVAPWTLAGSPAAALADAGNEP